MNVTDDFPGNVPTPSVPAAPPKLVVRYDCASGMRVSSPTD